MKTTRNKNFKKARRERKECATFTSKNEVDYELISELYLEGISIQFICKTLKVNRSSYYKWLNKEVSQRDIDNKKILEFIKKKQEEYKNIYGYRVMCAMVNREFGTKYNPKRIYRIMRVSGLQAIIRRNTTSKYKSSTPEEIAENIMNRDFSTSKPNEKWCCDVSEFKLSVNGSKVYLAAIIDLFDNAIVGYQVSNRNDNKLVFEAYKMALLNNQNATPMFHSDRGYQFTSKIFKKMLDKQGIKQSMSRVGKCIDNGPIEKFWAILKSEMIDYHKTENQEVLKDKIIKHIEYYNNERLQSRFNYQPPIEVREKAMEEELNGLTIKTYPIIPNPKVVKYWKEINKKSNTTQADDA